MINIAIIDDDIEVCNSLKKMLLRIYPEEVSVVTINAFDRFVFAQEETKRKPFDIVIMDIMLDRGLGIDLAVEYEKINRKSKVIFITGFIEYAPDIFRAKPFDLLRKPITADELKKSVDRALQEIEKENNEYIQLSSRDFIKNIRIKDILYVESRGRTIIVHTMSEDISIYMRMNDIEKGLGDKSFIRCHQSFLINLRHIYKMEGGKIFLFDQTEIPVSRTRTESSKRAIFEYIEMNSF